MKEILQGIKEAISDELDAQKKYSQLKEQSESEEAKSLYEQLVQDEKRHEKLLRSRYQAIKQSLENEENI